jgi:ferrous iron transport protein B
VTRIADRWIPWAAARDFLVGPYGVVSMALSYAFALILPIVATFFIAFGLLEDSGYLPRLSVLLDRVFRLMGLNGRAVLPMILGLGCDTMATMTTRILDTRKERIIVTLLLALTVPCSAQLAVILGMAAGLSPKVLGPVAGGDRRHHAPGRLGRFAGPPRGAVHLPHGNSAHSAAPFAQHRHENASAPVVVFEGSGAAFHLRHGRPLFLGPVGRVEGPGKNLFPGGAGFLGLPAQATEAFLIGFLRRDYGAAGLYRLQQDGALDLRQVTVSLVLITLFMPCVAQWLMMFKERGWKGALAITGAVLGIALLIAGGLNQVLILFPGLVL